MKPGTDKDVAAGSVALQAGAGGEGSGPRTCWCGPVSVCPEPEAPWAGGLLLAFQEIAACGVPANRREFLSVGFTACIC